ncbi:hypothetical protein PhCBS80983_g02172 [Powellomyces hirtus]|uniref:Cilia- and flagella-associated protein 58 central coiled coil domain-containing protein n=1 Tax=Powellomyces hirtus TaxID=109895 RepID=A0A507EA13_9FUNG|nr:hypothetical protein PhCBS80983_g02172 [Powellomyces hirtus]
MSSKRARRASIVGGSAASRADRDSASRGAEPRVEDSSGLEGPATTSDAGTARNMSTPGIPGSLNETAPGTAVENSGARMEPSSASAEEHASEIGVMPVSSSTETPGDDAAHQTAGAPSNQPESSASTGAVEVPEPIPEPIVNDLPGAEDKTHHDSLYVAMELEYDSTWQEIAEDTSLNPFRIEYEKMHRAVARSRDHIEKLYGQYERTHGEYRVHLAQTQDAKESSVHDQQLIKSLKAQIAKAEETVESSGKREENGKEELRQLRLEVANLNSTLKQGVGLSATQEKALQELLSAKEQSTKELDEELEKIVHLRNSIANVSERIKQADQQKRELEHEIYDLRDRSASKKADIDAELRNKERLERDLRELRVVVAVKSQEVRGKQDSVNRATDDISILESQIRSQKQMTEKLVKDQETLTTRTIQLQQEADEQMTMASQMIEENRVLANELSRREAELLKNSTEVKKVARIKEALGKKIQASEEQKLEAELERKGIRGECEGTLDEIDRMKRQTDIHKKSIDDLSRERDILENNFRKAQSELHGHGQMILLSKQARHNIELDLLRYERDTVDQEKKIKLLEGERDNYIVESIRLQSSCVTGIQDIKSKEIELFDFKKRTVQADTKLKHQQNLYEAVQSDRNLHSKHLIEAQAEISKMKRKLKIMNFQINGFKEDINSKNQALAAEAAEYARLQKDIEVITEEINTLQHQNELGQSYIRTQAAEASKLNQFVKEAEMERSRQENALNILVTERDNLSNQLIRQNEELAKVYNSLKLQQVSLLRSEKHYSQQVSQLNETRRTISELRRQKAVLKSQDAEFANTQETARQLENDLLTEQMRIKALEDQLQYPINVHRWRKLEGKNPKAFDMIQLLHSLQRQLISKSKEESDKEQMIHSKEMLYLYLKTLLAKQVGPEAIEQISEFQHILNDKTMQFKHMGTELNMYQAQLREYRYSITQLDKGMDKLKKQYMQQNRGKLVSIATVPKGRFKGRLSPGNPPVLPAMPRSPNSTSPHSRQSEQPSHAGTPHRYDSPDQESVLQPSAAFAAEDTLEYPQDRAETPGLDEPPSDPQHEMSEVPFDSRPGTTEDNELDM